MEPGLSYHIYNHANGKELLFREEDNYRYFLQKYQRYLGKAVDTYAFCLMPNHFHFLVGVKEDPLSHLAGFKNLPGGNSTKLGHASNNHVIKAFSDFFNSYTKAFNNRYERKGSLFVKSFKRKPILDLEQWQESFLYIHLNPVKHGFVRDVKDWKWSSWSSYQHTKRPSYLNREYYLNFFDGTNHIQEMMDIKKELILGKDFE